MTKLVDVQGLKPCPIRGSGSSPDAGTIHIPILVVMFKLVLFTIIKPS